LRKNYRYKENSTKKKKGRRADHLVETRVAMEHLPGKQTFLPLKKQRSKKEKVLKREKQDLGKP